MGRRLLGLFHPPNIRPEIARKVIALASELVTSNKIWLTFGRYIEMGKCAPENGKVGTSTGLANLLLQFFLLQGPKILWLPKPSVPGFVRRIPQEENVNALCWEKNRDAWKITATWICW